MAGIEAGFINLLISPKLVDDFAGSIGSDLEKTLVPAADKAGKAFSEKLSDNLNKAGKGLTAGVTAPILAIGGAAIAAGMDIDGAFDAIRVQTGATGDALEGLKEDFRAVAANTSASFEEAGGVIATLNQRLGLTGEPLQKLAEQLLNIKQITGDTADTDQVTKFFNAFGIGADKQSETLDKLFVISQKTGVGFNELVGQTLGQTAAFETLGFSAIEAAAFVGKLESSGANTGAVLAGLNKAIAASVSGDKAAEKATTDLAKAQSILQEKTLDLQVAETKLDEIRANPKAKPSDVLAAQNAVTKLKNEINAATTEIDTNNKIIAQSTGGVGVATETFFADTVAAIEGLIAAGDEAGAQTLAKDIFGAKGFTTVIKQIKDGTFNIQEFTAEVNSSTESINGLAGETADFPEQLAKLKNQASLALEPISDVLIPAITDAFTAAIPILEKVGGFLKGLSPETTRLIVIFAGLAAAIGPSLLIFAKLIESVKIVTTVVKAMNLAVLANPWVLAAAAAIAVVYLIIKNWESISGFFKGLWDDIVAITKSAADSIAGAFSSVANFFIGIWDGLVSGTAAAFGAISGAVSNALKSVTDLFRGTIDFIKNNWLSILGFLTGPIGQAVVAIIKNWGTIKTGFINLVNNIKGAAGAIYNFLATPFKNAASQIGNFLQGIKNATANVVNTIVNLFNTMRNGIANAIKALTNLPGFKQIAGIFGAASSAFGKVFGGGKAAGGPVNANTAYLVGEQGPEIMVPKGSGTILPNNVLGGLLGGGGGASYTVNVYNPVAEPSSASIPAALRRANLLRSNA
jgi:phage-related minor tail protein